MHGTNGATNLKGPNKAAFLKETFNGKRLAYMGDSPADLPVWAAVLGLALLSTALAYVLVKVINFRAFAWTMSFEADAAVPAPVVVGDEVRLRQVVDNLLSNAIKYTHQGGTVRISCEVVDDEVVTHISDTIADYLERHGFASVGDLVGTLQS